MAQEALGALTRACAAALALAALAAPGALAAEPAKAKRLAWAELTAEQQQVLAPLKPSWDTLEPQNRRKWIGVAKRYPKMTPVGQKRVQTRMEKWANLSPEQRRVARERYKSIGKLPPEKRQTLRQQWAEYQALPPHERRMLDAPAVEARPAERKRRPQTETQPSSAASRLNIP
jgi:hypothetical protein